MNLFEEENYDCLLYTSYIQGFYGIMDEKNGRLYAESGPEREVCAMTMKCPNCGAEFFDGRERCV